MAPPAELGAENGRNKYQNKALGTGTKNGMQKACVSGYFVLLDKAPQFSVKSAVEKEPV